MQALTSLLTFEIIALMEKSLKSSRKLRRKPYVQLVKKIPKLDEKMRIKTGKGLN